MKIYYAHCVQIYNTKQEQRDVKLLQELGFKVENPNQPRHQKGYMDKGMDYFIHGFLSFCDAIAFRALPDGSLPAGVAKEIDHFQKAGKPIIEIPGFVLRRRLSVEETRAYLHECGQR
jgi:hypothetical protein